MAHDVFISHSSINKAAADAVCHVLEENGVRCWIAPRDIPPGTKYGEQITKGLRDCKIFLLVFSDEVNNSEAVQKEIERAVLGYRKVVIPFFIENVPMNDNIDFFLADTHRINAFRDKHWIDAYPNNTVFTELIKAVKNALGMSVVEKMQSHPETRESKISEQLSTSPKSAQLLTSQPPKQINSPSNVKVGDIIPFGKYEWQVLDVQGDKALIITKDCISLMKIECNSHSGYATFPYSGSNIRTYVDIEFRNSFSEEEKSKIIYPTTINEYGSTLYEHVFLLSVDEAKKYFKSDRDRAAAYECQSVWWWLRSNGKDSSKIAYVHKGIGRQVQGIGNAGEIDEYGLPIDYRAADSLSDAGGIRPALWLKIDNTSTENPIKFIPKTISLNELNVVHSPLNEKDYFHLGVKVMGDIYSSMLQMDEWLYFTNPKDFKLYKIKVNGEGLLRVSKGVVHRKSIFDGYIYFVDEGRSNYIFRTDGNECKMFVDANIQFPFTLTPKGLVYSERGYAGNPFMAAKPERYVLVDYNGNKVNEERFFVHDVCSDENYVFFTKEEEGATLLYRADFDGTNMQKVCDESCYIFGLSNGFIYIINKDDNNKLYKVCADGTQLTDLCFLENCNQPVMRDNVLYYNFLTSNIIKKYVIEKRQEELLLEITGGQPTFFNIIGNWMFVLIELRGQDPIEYYLSRMNLIDGTFETIAKL